MAVNNGALLLQKQVKKAGSQSDLAEKLQVHLPTLNRWLSGQRVPKTQYRMLMQDLLGIHWRLWDESVEGDAA